MVHDKGGRERCPSSSIMPSVAWTRNLMKKHPFPKGSLDEMETALRNTLANCARYVNDNYEVEGLHQSFPKRIAEMVRLKGDRLVRH